MSRRKIRQEKSKFYGTKQVLQDLNQPAHLAAHDLDPVAPGIPAGGLAGQVLAKASDEDYDLFWADVFSLFPANVDGGDAATLASSFIDGGTAVPDQVNVLDGGTA